MSPLAQVKFPPIDFPPPAPIQWSLIAIILGLLVPATVWLLWPKRKGRFFDAYLWALLSVPLFFIYRDSEDGFAVNSPVYPAFNVLLAISAVAGMVIAVLRMSKSEKNGLYMSLPCFVILACIIPPSRNIRGVVRRSQCKNHLKQLGLALHNYHDVYGTLPAPAADGLSWRVRVLPFIDQEAFYKRYDQLAVWNQGANLALSRIRIPMLQCPSRTISRPGDPAGQIDYVLPIGHLGIFETADSTPNLKDIGDGSSNTIAYVEASGRNIIWNEPRDVNFDELPIGINLPGPRAGESYGVFSGYHSDGVQTTLADGSVRYLSDKIDSRVLKRLLQANDGEPVGDY